MLNRQRHANTLALLVLAGLYVALAIVYDDVGAQRCFMSWAGVAALYYGSLFVLPARVFIPLGECVAVAAGVHMQTVLPADVAGPIFLVPLTLSIFITTSSTLRGVGLLAMMLIGRAAIPLFGFEYGGPSPIPTWLWIAATVGPSTLALLQVGHERARSADEDSLAAAEAEAELAREEQSLELQRRALEQSAQRLRERQAQTTEALARAAERNDQLRQQRASEQDLVQAIRDDLRQPLRGIVSFSQLLTRRISDLPAAEAATPMLEFVVDGGKRMSVMLDDLLAYASTDAEQDLAFSAIDLNDVLRTVRDDLAAMLVKSGARLTVVGDLPTVSGQHTQLVRLFQNLIANAVKFAKPNTQPTLRIRSERNGGRVLVHVEDDGLGIPASMLPKIFGLFNRAHEQRGIEGSGVGLALCRRIAIAHQADLSVTSQEGKGTVFTLDVTAACVAGHRPHTKATATPKRMETA